MTAVPGIYKKLHLIMSEANYIQKDKKNPHFGYSYASEAAIKETLHELFVKHGVMPSFSTLNQQITEMYRNEKGKAQYRTTLTLAFRFFDIDDGSSVEGTMEGAGVDGEDKGTYKAITGALKYCLTSQFIIPTGDDPESDNGEKPKAEAKPANKGRESTTIGAPKLAAPAPLPQQPPMPVNVSSGAQDSFISEKQRNRFIAIYSKNGWTDDQVKALLGEFNISSRSLIPKSHYDKLCTIAENGYAIYLDSKSNPVGA